MLDAFVQAGKDVSYVNIDSPYGHDAFLLEYELETKLIGTFLYATYNNEMFWEEKW
jgi:homoserine O-acetyltransferase